MRLFRIFDEDDSEIGFGVYNWRRGRWVVSMLGDSRKYRIFFIADSVLKLGNSFLWCCSGAKAWHGHEDMNVLAL